MAGNISKTRKPMSFKEVMTNPIHCLAFGLGSGLSPIAPGTMGSLIALPMAYALQQTTPMIYLLVTLCVTIGGIFISDKSSKLMGVHDHGGIVIDEIAGVLWIFAFFKMTILSAVLGFFAFRFFDILKPWPVCYFDEKVDGGLGIMLDDLAAAIYTIIAVGCLLYGFSLLQ